MSANPKKNRVDADLKPDRPFNHPGHSLRTRRDFFASGALSMAGYVLAPNLISMLSSTRAFGSTCPPPVTTLTGPRIPFFSVEAAGGWGGVGSIVAHGPSGQFLPNDSYVRLSWDTTAAPGAVGVDSTYGIPMYAGAGNRFLSGLNSVITDPAIRAKINAIALPNANMDDSAANPKCAMSALARLQDLSYLLIHTVGNSDSASGTRSASPDGGLPASIRSTLVRSPQDAISLVTPGNLATLLGPESVKKVLAASGRMSERALDSFKQRGLAEQAAELMKCGFADALGQLTRFGEQQLNPSTDTRLNTVFNFNDGEQANAGAIAKLVLEGYAQCGKLTYGGYDYHGNAQDVTGNLDNLLGQRVGRLFVAAHNFGLPCAIYLHSDGSVGASGQGQANGSGRHMWVSDRGEAGCDYFLVMGASERPEIAGGEHQIGWFTNAAGVDRQSSKIANSPTNAAYCVLYNYLALLGQESRLKEALGGSIDPFTESDAAAYRKFSKIV
jgi:hypothetical protein